MAKVEYPQGSVGASGDNELIERIASHYGDEYLSWTPAQIYWLGDQADPRVVAANRTYGQETARGGSGPKVR